MWRPLRVELGFGLPADPGRDPMSVAEPVTLEGGAILRGAVDLVERSVDGKHLRVTDHKTGVDRTAKGMIVGRGETLQPVLYGLAVEAVLGETVGEARLFFCTSRGAFAERVVSLDDRARNVGRAALAIIDRSIAAGVLPLVIEHFSRRYPKVMLHVVQTTTHLQGFEALHARKADMVLTLMPKPFEQDITEHLQAEVLFYDRVCLVAAMHSPWARRRKIGLADLAHAALIAPASDTPGGTAVIEAFRAAGLPAPQISVTTFSVHLRSILSMRGDYIAVLPVSILEFNPGLYALKELPLDLAMPKPPALVVTLKNRTLSPPAERFIACAHEVARTVHAPSSQRVPASINEHRTMAQQR